MTENNPKKNFELYLERKRLSQNTIKQYLFYFDKVSYENFNQDELNLFLDKFNNPVARAFVKNLSSFLNLKLDIPKITGRKSLKLPVIISRDEVNRLFSGLDNTRNKLMVALTYQGGLRVSELLNIKALDFRWDKWKLDKEQPGELVITGKGDKQRIVFLTPPVMQYCYEYIKALEEHLTTEDCIFPISSRRWEFILEKVSLKILGKKINPHSLRHSCADYLYNELGWKLEDVKEYLGHSSIQTTMIYAKVNKKTLKEKFNQSFK